jgi:hypothetical protein
MRVLSTAPGASIRRTAVGHFTMAHSTVESEQHDEQRERADKGVGKQVDPAPAALTRRRGRPELGSAVRRLVASCPWRQQRSSIR